MAITADELNILSGEITVLMVEAGVPSADVRLNVHAAQSPDAWISVSVPTAQRSKLLNVLPKDVRGVMVRLGTPGTQPIAIRENKLDTKFHGVICRDTTGTPLPPDEYVIFCAYDDAIPGTLAKYVEECIAIGAPPAQIDAARTLTRRVQDWRDSHAPRCRKPGTGETPRVATSSERVRLWPRPNEEHPGTETTVPSALPPLHKTTVASWLEINQKTPTDVYHGVYPLGFVQNLMERVATAEQAAGISNNGITAKMFRLPEPEQPSLPPLPSPFEPLQAVAGAAAKMVPHDADLRATLATKGAPAIAAFLEYNRLASVAVWVMPNRFMLLFADTATPIPENVLAECDRQAVIPAPNVFAKVWDGSFEQWMTLE